MALSTTTHESLSYNRSSYPQVLEYANENRQEGFFVDVKIAVDNELIPANRLILSCYSKVFDRMFKTNMREQNEHIVNLTADSVDGFSARKLINFMYSGTITINKDNALLLLAASDYLQIDEVKKACVEFLESILSLANCHRFLVIADLYRLESLQKQIYNLISRNFDDFIASDNFKTFTENVLSSCIFQLNRIQVKETSVFKAILTWTKYEEHIRKGNFPELFGLVNLNKLTTTFLQNEVFTENLISSNAGCLNRVTRTLFNRSQNVQTVPRTNASKILAIGGEYTTGEIRVVVRYKNEPAIAYPNLPIGFESGWSVKLHDYIYCLGGEAKNAFTDRMEATNKVFRLNVYSENAVFEEVAAMNNRRSGFSAAVLLDTIVVSGGVDSDDKSVESSECYIPQLNEWKVIAQPHIKKHYHVLVSCKRYVYSIGGVDGRNGLPLSSVERLKGIREEWGDVAPMNENRGALAAAACGGCIYAIGGRNGKFWSSRTNTVEKYDPSLNEWSYVQPMKFCRSGHEACEFDGKIYVLGGSDAQGNIVRQIEFYDPKTNTWGDLGSTASKLFNQSLVAV